MTEHTAPINNYEPLSMIDEHHEDTPSQSCWFAIRPYIIVSTRVHAGMYADVSKLSKPAFQPVTTHMHAVHSWKAYQ